MTRRPYNHELKLERALHHLKNFEAETNAWLQSKPYRLVHDRDIQSGEKLLIVEPTESVPPEFAAIVGDFLHNARSALDSLIYEIAVLNEGTPPDDVAKNIEFPVLTHRSLNARDLREKLWGVPPRARAVVKESQPYEQGDDARSHILHVLHALSVKDKHRFPHLGFFSPREITFHLHGGLMPVTAGDLKVVPNWGPAEGRAVIARYSSPPGTYAEMDMQRPPTFFVAFGEGSEDIIYGAEVVGVLREIYGWTTQKLIPRLTPYLT